MRKIRKVDTNKRKKVRKKAEQRLQEKTAAFLRHPKECCVCKTAIERNKETVVSWQVVVREDRVRLTCPSCWKAVSEAREKVEELRQELKNEN